MNDSPLDQATDETCRDCTHLASWPDISPPSTVGLVCAHPIAPTIPSILACIADNADPAPFCRWYTSKATSTPLGWKLQVFRTISQQWGWVVLDPEGRDVVAGGGYDTEDDARQEGEAELAVQSAPLKALIV